MRRTEGKNPKQYVVVLAHADGWGALAANQLIQQLHEQYPRLGIHLVVSTATKNKKGEITTKLPDLKPMRELKETNMLAYFKAIDALYDKLPAPREVERILRSGAAPAGLPEGEQLDYFFNLGKQTAQLRSADLLTFKQLAKQYCFDETVHYTTSGGPKGGIEAAAEIGKIKKRYHNGKGPEVLLSVDTMAILPKELLERYNCLSTHPGPIDTIKIEGMQGTERALVNQVLYDENGRPLPAMDNMDMALVISQGKAHLKGTMFLQHPELDKGPPISTVLTPISHDMCAYEARDRLYKALVNRMIKFLPKLLDKDRRSTLIAEQTRKKVKLDEKPHVTIPDLDADQFARWQGQSVGMPTGEGPLGLTVMQNTIVDPHYFKYQMARFYPGAGREDDSWAGKESDSQFNTAFDTAFNSTLERVESQKRLHLESDPWAMLATGRDVTIRRYNPKTGDVIATYGNKDGKFFSRE